MSLKSAAQRAGILNLAPHGAEAGAVHGNQVVRVDLLHGFHGPCDRFIRIGGQVPLANHGVHLLDPSGLLDLADGVDDAAGRKLNETRDADSISALSGVTDIFWAPRDVSFEARLS
jgi:hypothetical protein